MPTPRTLSRSLLTIAALVTLSIRSAGAQEIDARVNVNADQINPASRQDVDGFADELERYIDNTKWTELEWEGEKIPMNLSVVLTGGGEGYYTAKLVVGSQRVLHKSGNLSPMMKILDEHWAFRYVRNQPIQRDPTGYDELSGLIDFYVYIALGLDLDSYGYLTGDAMYQMARDIANRAQLRSDSKGWTTQATQGSYSRFGMLRELSELRYNPIRKFIYDYHYNGLDLIATNRAAALDSVASHLTKLAYVKDNLVEQSTLIRILNDTKYIEYSELFIRYHDPSIWRKLVFIDPIHQTLYQESAEK